MKYMCVKMCKSLTVFDSAESISWRCMLSIEQKHSSESHIVLPDVSDAFLDIFFSIIK